MLKLEYSEGSNTYRINNKEVDALQMIDVDNPAGAAFNKAGLELDLNNLNICDVPTLHEEYRPSNSNPRIYSLSEFGSDEIGQVVLYKDSDSDNLLTVELTIHLDNDQKEL